MARRAGVLTFLVLVGSLQAASAQAPVPDGWYLSDARDDVVAAGSTGIPSAVVGSADLLGLAVNVLEGSIAFRIETAAPTTEVPVAHSVDYCLDFAVAGLPYRLEIQRLLYADPDYLGTPAYMAWLLVYDAATEAYRPLLQPVVQPGTSSASFEAFVPLDELRSPDGLPLVSGHSLEAARLQSTWTFADKSIAPNPVVTPPSGVPAWTDALPDSASIDIPIVLPVSDATVRLSPSTVVKVSNGEPRLMFFATSATNTDTQDLELEVAIEEVPPWWRLKVGSPRVTLAAGTTVPLFFVVQTLGRHVHGTFDQVNFTLTDQLGRESPGSLRIDYHNIPYPSGHHPRVYVHSLGTASLVPAPSATSPVSGYMNTLEDDERDTGEGLANRLSGGAASWDVPLSPELKLGLLFDPQGPSQLALCLRQVGPLAPQDAEVWGTISIETAAGPVVLLESETVHLELSDQPGCVELPMTQKGPRSIDPRPGHNLVLSAYALLDDPGVGLGTTRIHLMPNSWAHLPLHEYVEPLPQAEGQPLAWVGLSDPRQVPIGNSSLTLTLASSQDRPARLLLDVSPPLDWHIKFSAAAIEVPAGGETTIDLQVSVPEGADFGRPVQAVLLATDEDGHAVLGSLLLVPDAAVQAVPAPEAEAPATSLSIVALALLAAVFVRRRHS